MQNNPQEPQYFAVGASEPAPRPFWRTWKAAALGGGALFVVLLAVVVVNMVSLRRDRVTDDVRNQLAQALALCENEADPEDCKMQVRNTLAKDSGSAEVCEGMTGTSYASCVSLAAREQGDVDACADLSEEAKLLCEDLALRAKAEEDFDIRVCADINDTGARTACEASITGMATASGRCTEAHVDTARCDRESALRTAMEQGTQAACAELPLPEDQYACRRGIASIDEDDDGLVLEDERRYGSSDNDADSDDDGYDDGTEVKGGFSPTS